MPSTSPTSSSPLFPTDIDRELLVLKREEQKLVREIKDAAAKGNQAGAKTLAKQLIRIRNQMQRLTVHNAQMKGVSAQITVRSHIHYSLPHVYVSHTDGRGNRNGGQHNGQHEQGHGADGQDLGSNQDAGDNAGV